MQLKIVAKTSDENYTIVTEEDSVSRKEKLINRLKSCPKDLTFEEVINLLQYFGYEEYHKGRTSGSRVIFKMIIMHLYCFISHILEKHYWSIK